jgi:hypothetical protein
LKITFKTIFIALVCVVSLIALGPLTSWGDGETPNPIWVPPFEPLPNMWVPPFEPLPNMWVPPFEPLPNVSVPPFEPLPNMWAPPFEPLPDQWTPPFWEPHENPVSDNLYTPDPQRNYPRPTRISRPPANSLFDNHRLY